jgi:hypothetical protein
VPAKDKASVRDQRSREVQPAQQNSSVLPAGLILDESPGLLQGLYGTVSPSL